MTRWSLSLLLLSLSLLAAPLTPLTPDDFVTLSDATTPPVRLALVQAAGRLTVVVDVAPWSAAQPDSVVTLAGSCGPVAEARLTRLPDALRHTFALPPTDLESLRLAVGVRWTGGGLDLARARYRCLDVRAPHAPLPANAADCAPLSLAEYDKLVADRRQQLALDLVQPFDGKATLVIENAAGARVRNLLGGEPLARGARRVAWDGLDDAGRPVPPGDYRWRGVVHPGLTPRFLFSFCNAPGSNHATFEAATTNGRQVFLGAPVTEGGYCMVALEPDGTFRRGFNPLAGQGLYAVALAADDKYLYAVHDGPFWGEHIDRAQARWKARYQLSVERFSLETGGAVDYPGGKRFVVVGTTEVGPGSPEQRADRVALAGAALLDGKLYVADAQHDDLLTVDAATGRTLAHQPLVKPVALAAGDGKLFAVADGAVVGLVGSTRRFPLGRLQPAGLAVLPDRLLVSDRADHTIKSLGLARTDFATLGRPGGPYSGTYDPLRLINPAGLTVGPNGWLWVAEQGRWTPKRLAAFDLATGQVVKELFGPTAYGAPAAGIDPRDHERWLGQSTLWHVDFAKQTARPTHIVSPEPLATRHARFLVRDGRTFAICVSQATELYEVLPTGVFKALAIFSSCHRYCFDHGWNPPAVWVEAFNRAFPTRRGKHSEKGPGFLWLDRNGDGLMQADELEFTGASIDNFAGGYWGHDSVDLTLRVPATIRGARRLVTLAPRGWLTGGAPDYPSLADACAAAVPLDLDGNEVETCSDSFGRLICNSDPTMKAFGADGKLLWHYPNRWTNVHGSHNAPLPQTGVLQGVLFFDGMAPFDAQGDVMVLTGNHGRLFAMTSDGLYLDEMFKDCRLGGANDEYMIGGEAFGGTFERSAADGNYYLQAGGIEYRVFRLDGLPQVKRVSGTLTVSPAQVAAAERELARRVAAVSVPKVAAVARCDRPPTLDGQDGDWPGAPTVVWDRDGRFPVSARLGYDATHLYLHYRVADDSPWVNRGQDWQMLFKTGDSVDLQLGTNPRAPADRSGPVPGDLRLLLAPFGNEDIAVLYRHRLPGPSPDSVVFQCPWRSEKVDSVRRLTGARIKVVRGGGGYTLAAAVPLADLGLTNPAGLSLRGDLGVIYGDRDGTLNLLRSYWSNSATMLVNDVPGEIMLTPRLWGTLNFAEVRR